MPLVATAGAADANSYVTLEEANTYFAAGAHLLSDVWNSLPDDDEDAAKKACLITATRHMDRLRFWGCKVSEDQALQFPREFCGWKRNEIPLQLRHATLEQAVSLAPNHATGGQSPREKLQAAGVKSYSMGELSETFSDARLGTGVPSAESKLCEDARILLTGFIKRVGQVRPGRRLS